MLIYCSVCVCVFIFRLLFIDTAFQTLKLNAEDSSGRQHILTVKLKSKVRHTYTETHTPTLSRRKLCIDKWSTPRLDVNPSPVSIQTGRLSPNAQGMFNFAIANQWFTSVPSNLGQTGEGVERHDNPLWLRCSTDKTSPHRPLRNRRKPVRPRSSA